MAKPEWGQTLCKVTFESFKYEQATYLLNL